MGESHFSRVPAQVSPCVGLNGVWIDPPGLVGKAEVLTLIEEMSRNQLAVQEASIARGEDTDWPSGPSHFLPDPHFTLCLGWSPACVP